MSPSDADGPLISAARGGQVTLAAAARELGLAWAAADDEARRTSGEGMLRLRELNLIVHAASVADGRAVRAVSAHFIREHSGRVILLVPPDAALLPAAREAATPPALISTECFVEQHSGRQVCSEMVIIGATGKEGRAARAAVVGLLVPDLPVIGWWSGGFSPTDPILRWLAELGDQLVVDSERVDHPSGGDARPVRLGVGLGGSADLVGALESIPVRDLAWLRAAPWRALTAEVFDGAQCRRLLPRVSHLVVEHRGAWAQALLFCAWFGSRVGLDAVDERRLERGSLLGTLGRSVGANEFGWAPAALRIESRSLKIEDGDTPGLAGVSVYVDSPDETFDRPLVSIRRKPRSRACIARVAAGRNETLAKTLEMPLDDDWRLLSQILETPGSDGVYPRAARLAAALAKARKGTVARSPRGRGGASEASDDSHPS